MNQLQIFEYVGSFGAKIAVISVLTCIFLLALSSVKIIKKSKTINFLPYFIGITLSFLYELIFKCDGDFFKTGMTAGGIAVVLATAMGFDVFYGNDKLRVITALLSTSMNATSATECAKKLLSVDVTKPKEEAIIQIHQTLSAYRNIQQMHDEALVGYLYSVLKDVEETTD